MSVARRTDNRQSIREKGTMSTPDKKAAKRAYGLRRREQMRTERNGGIYKPIWTRFIVKMYGLRVIVGSFDKHNPVTLYYEGTVNCEGTNDYRALKKVEDRLKELFDKWILEQEDYEQKYIRVFNSNYNCERTKYVGKNKHISFEITLKQKQLRPWSEAADAAKRNLTNLYDRIVKAVEDSGLVLKDFPGHNKKQQC